MARRTVSLDELDKFETDDNDRLYWKGAAVVTELRLSLSWWTGTAVIFAAISTFGMFMIMGLQATGFVQSPQGNVTVNYDKPPVVKSR